MKVEDPLAKRLAERLEEEGLSQSQFATYIGVTGGCVSQWVSGVRAISDSYRTIVEEYVNSEVGGWIPEAFVVPRSVFQALGMVERLSFREVEEFWTKIRKISEDANIPLGENTWKGIVLDMFPGRIRPD